MNLTIVQILGTFLAIIVIGMVIVVFSDSDFPSMIRQFFSNGIPNY